jgi:hypothetical protein
MLRSGNPAPERMATPKPLLDVLQRKLIRRWPSGARCRGRMRGRPSPPEATRSVTPSNRRPHWLLPSLRQSPRRP